MRNGNCKLKNVLLVYKFSIYNGFLLFSCFALNLYFIDVMLKTIRALIGSYCNCFIIVNINNRDSALNLDSKKFRCLELANNCHLVIHNLQETSLELVLRVLLLLQQGIFPAQYSNV